jgi:hypothetical protein
MEDIFPSTTRQALRLAVDQVAAKAKATLPDNAGRIEKAVQLILQGDVVLLEGGHAQVASQCQGTTVYRVVNGTCECKDFPHAPASWCKHRLAHSILRRALQAMPPVQPTPPALPEAPASVNCHVTIDGRQVQVTLRDTDEARLLSRLTTLLAQYPVPTDTPTIAKGTTGQAEGFCAIHHTPMRQNTKDGHRWFSHKAEDGSWCKGKTTGQGR